MRQFRDEAGTEWRVSLTPRGSDAVSRENYLPEAYREGWLVFESTREKRRLAPVPSDWENLPVEELVRLCGTAVPQTARARLPADSKAPVSAETKTPATTDALRPQLEKVEEQLDRTLEQVCETPSAARLDTGELIRVEESLALATEAAKEAVSLRRKMRADRDRATSPASDASTPPKEDGGHVAR